MIKIKHFPSWRYHKELGEKLVQNESECAALGKGWFDSPAGFDSIEQEPASETKTIPVDVGIIPAWLLEKCMEMGVTKKKLKGMTHAEMLELVKGEK